MDPSLAFAVIIDDRISSACGGFAKALANPLPTKRAVGRISGDLHEGGLVIVGRSQTESG